MTDLDGIIQIATQAMCQQNFRDADAVLQRGLQSSNDLKEKRLFFNI